MPDLERTFVIIKPDGVERRLTGEIISRIEKKGLRISALKMLKITPELAAKHYAEHKGKPFYDDLIRFITSGHVIAMVIEGERAVEIVRNMIGPTDGGLAPTGTLRGDYSNSKKFNMVHGADSLASAKREIAHFFRPEEIYPEEPVCWL